MKREHLLLVMLLMILPAVNAESCEGVFELDKALLQWGDEFVLSGSEVKIDNEDYTGNIIINFENDQEYSHSIYFYAYKGNFEFRGYFASDQELNGYGNYVVDVDLVREGENICDIETDIEFEVTNELIIFMELVKSEYDPGDSVELDGTIQRKSGGPVGDGSVRIDFDGEEYSASFADGQFRYIIPLSSTIASGYHSVNLFFEDDFGNRLDESTNIYVVPEAKRVEVSVDKESYLPSETVLITARVYDQADEEVLETVDVRLYDPEEERLIKGTMKTSEFLEHALDKYESMPGEWVAKVRFDNLIAEVTFEVQRVEEIVTSFENQILTITNEGNVKYTKPLIVLADDGENVKLIERNTNLAPGDSFYLELFKYLSSGKYFITVENTGDEYSSSVMDERNLLQRARDTLSAMTGSVVGTPGSPTSNVAAYVMIFLLLFIVVALYLRYRVMGHKTTRTKYHGRRINFSKITPHVFSKKTDKAADIAEFKQRILKDIEDFEKSKDGEVKPTSEQPAPAKPEDDFYKPMTSDTGKKKKEEGKVREGLFKMFE